MRNVLVITFGLTVFGAIALLGMSVSPGVLQVVLFDFPLGCLFLPCVGAFLVVLIALAAWDLSGKRPEQQRRWGIWSAVVMATAIGLVWLHLPQRLALFMYSSELQGLVDVAPVDGFRRGTLKRWIGPFYIDQYGIDHAGGAYFRTFTGPDGIGPDEMQYGFAFRPSGEGPPFGRSRHRLRHLFGDWYTFEGSSD